jgi:hypothetical protein
MEKARAAAGTICWLALSGVLVLCAGTPRVALGQGAAANVGGIVTDDSGLPLPGVTVTITNLSNGRSQVVISGPEGNYRAVALQPARYSIAAELQGFAGAKREIVLNVGTDITIDLKLSVATVQETITVVAETPLVEVAKSQPTSVVEAEQIATMPVLSRNFLELAQLLPGSGPDNSRTQAWTVTKFGGAADQRNGFTTIIDGGTINDDIWGSTLVNVSQEAVQEFTVFRNRFDAEYGLALSAAVSVATKSGTNDLRGSAFFFGRDRALAARNAFAVEKPEFDQQRVGGTFGGPLVANRTHFFGAYEYNNVDTVRILALPPTNPFNSENGVWPSGMTDHMTLARFDHRFNDSNSVYARYLYDDAFILRERDGAESNQVSEPNQTHSFVAQHSWIASQNVVNTLRFHFLDQYLALLAHDDSLTISRPSIQLGSAVNAPQFFPRRNLSFGDSLYINTPRHALKFGGDVTFFRGTHESYWNDQGTFSFSTDAPFSPANQATWPFAFTIQEPGLWQYNSTMISLFAQDDWRLGDRMRLNLGLRYDVDTNLRNNEFYESLLDDPAYAGIDQFISRDRGNDLNNIQPRVGATYDARGDGTLVLRGGWGIYTARNRPWLQLTSVDLSKSVSIRIEDPARLSAFPSIEGVLGGQPISTFLAGSRSLFLIDDNYEVPESFNTTIGAGWQIGSASSVDVDYVHAYGRKQLGSTDRNLPASGPLSATNPRPVRNFTQVSVMENFTESWYDALEVQFRTRVKDANSFRASYTLSRNYRDGVHFYSTFRGTQRTPNERGYNENDQRHNLTMAASSNLPWGLQVSGIVKLISGSPFAVQAGVDLDGDQSPTNDRPAGIPITVGRDNVDESLRVINEFRSARGLPPVSADLLKLEPFISVDARATKVVTLGGDQRIELFLEGFNLTNHVNYTPFVNSNMVARDFLVRRSARDARQIQWGVRYAF